MPQLIQLQIWSQKKPKKETFKKDFPDLRYSSSDFFKGRI